MATIPPPALLRKYIAANYLTPAEFARRAGINAGYLSTLLSGQRSAGLAVATRIEAATRKSVPAKSWIGFTPKKRAA